MVWSASEFAGFRHGYAGTIYKGQGKTLDHTYLYHTHHWRSAASYVALTRQREKAQVFVASETARDVRELARQMRRREVKAASVAYATFSKRDPRPCFSRHCWCSGRAVHAPRRRLDRASPTALA